MIEFIGAFLGAGIGTFVGTFGWHWYVEKQLSKEIEKLPLYLKATILKQGYED